MLTLVVGGGLSGQVLAGTHGCDVWAVGTRRTEPVIYGHSAYVNGLAFHPTKPAWFVTASEASRIFVWDAHKRCLLAKRNVHRCAPPPPPPSHALALGRVEVRVIGARVAMRGVCSQTARAVRYAKAESLSLEP
jgi:hypothetical protein